ncbi:MAG TPA: glycosyltransferase [Bryobacteraceae bacterium]|nr:glycosyltransferase [Bryobacteraceae bacterium]
MPSRPRILYYTPDTNQPSWGIGMLYTHVRLLVENGFDARVLHRQSAFRLAWLDIEVPREALDDPDFHLSPDDLLVVPEVVVARQVVRDLHCRRIVFVQGSSLIVPGLREHHGYADLGYERAIAVMPHVAKILERHFDLPVSVIPPSIAPYFFADLVAQAVPPANPERQPQIALYPKPLCEDQQNLEWLLRRGLSGREPWRLVELCGLSHRQVAEVMRQSAFHVSVNCQESFNATVPEAMAAGCIPVCYEAYGGQDFLRDGHNAYVFPNHHLYPLVERLFELMDDYPNRSEELATMRARAFQTATGYREARTAQALVEFYRPLL